VRRVNNMRADLDHIVLSVRDVDEALRFYLEVLGLEPYRVDEWREGEIIFPSVRLGPASIIDLLPPQFWDIEYEEEDADPMPDGGSGEGSRAANLNHFCLAVSIDDWDPLMQRLSRAGVPLEGGIMILHGARGDAEAVYLSDPDGNQLELRRYRE
jgi:glyoxylase I family protein